MKLLLDGEFRGLPRLLHKVVLRGMIKQIQPYHPLSMEGTVMSLGERECSDRWTVIKKVLSEGPSTVLDLGCAEGYFVSNAAQEYGCFALGVDADIRRLTIAQDLSVLNRRERAGFMYARLTLEFLDTLPRFDVVILLAVLHHIMYEHGVEFAREFMTHVRAKTGSSLIFEMGQSNETTMAWASLLPDMGANPHEWIKNFLLSCGFSRVVKAGETDAYQSSTRRGVFVAYS